MEAFTIIAEGAIDEKVSIHRRPDNGDSEAARGRCRGCRPVSRDNISTALIYQWRSKYGGMDASMMRRLKELEAKNSRLKKMYAEERIKAELRQEESCKAISAPRGAQEGCSEARDQCPVGLCGVRY